MYQKQLAQVQGNAVAAAKFSADYVQKNKSTIWQLAILMNSIDGANQFLNRNTSIAVYPTEVSVASNLISFIALMSTDIAQRGVNAGLQACSQYLPESFKQTFFKAPDNSSSNDDIIEKTVTVDTTVEHHVEVSHSM